MQPENDRSFESAIIASICIDNRCLPEVMELVTPGDFQDPFMKAAFAFSIQQYSSGKPIDVVVLEAELNRQNFADVKQRLAELMLWVPTAANAGEYARQLRESSQRNLFLKDALGYQDALQTSDDSSSVAVEMIAKLQDSLKKSCLPVNTPANDGADFLEHFHQVREDPLRSVIPTKLKSLDKILGGGLFRGGLYVIGARPSIGKTSFALNVAEGLVSNGVPTLFISLEMTKYQLISKRVARFAELPVTEILNGTLPEEDDQKVSNAVELLADYPLYFSDESGLNVSQIESLIRRIPNLGCVILDYLGLVEPLPDDSRKSTYEIVTTNSKRLKALAKQLDIPIICLAQLNRNTENSTDHTPHLWQLRDSGAIEADADSILLLSRDDFYLENPPDHQILDVLVVKNRHGGTGKVSFSWEGITGLISEVQYG